MGEIAEYLSKIGRRGGQIGGKAKSKAKVKAARANFKKAVGALRKYPPCTEYTNRSHRFKPVSDLLGNGFYESDRSTPEWARRGQAYILDSLNSNTCVLARVTDGVAGGLSGRGDDSPCVSAHLVD